MRILLTTAMIALAATIVYALPTNAQTPEPTPINVVINEQTNAADAIRFAGARCAGLYTALAARVPNQPEMQAQLIEAGSLLLLAAQEAEIEAGIGKIYAQQVVQNNMNRAAEMYVTRADQHYTLTGNYFQGDGLAEDDLMVCKVLAEGQ